MRLTMNKHIMNPCVETFITPARENDFGMILRLYADIFSRDEPLTCHMGFSKERIKAVAETMYPAKNNDSLRRGLWLKATLGRNIVNPVGFIVTNDISSESTNEPPEGLTEEEIAKAAPVMAFLEEVRRPLNAKYTFKKGQCLHITALGVKTGYEGMGIAGRLLERALERAKDVGYGYAASECTGPASKRCHEKRGFQTLHSVKYADFTIHGNRPFENLHGECHLLLKE